MRLVERDINILKSLFSFGFLTSEQIAMLYEWHPKVCQRRLKLLAQKNYLAKIPIPTFKSGRPKSLFSLGKQTEKMFNIQVSKPRLNWKTTHAIKNIDLLIQAAMSCRNSDIDYDLLPEHIIRAVGQDIIPDGSFILKRDKKTALFLLENCAGTEIITSPSFNEDIEAKIIRYVELFEKNDLEFYEDFFGCDLNRFRLLYITNNYHRQRAISEVIAEHDTHGFIWMTTMNDFKTKGLCSDIWHIPSHNAFKRTIV